MGGVVVMGNDIKSILHLVPDSIHAVPTFSSRIIWKKGGLMARCPLSLATK